MTIRRKATAIWHGSGKSGQGALTTQSSTLNETPYNTPSRFADGLQTNPEELIAAAHAGCFNMKLAFVMAEHGFTPDNLETDCIVTIGDDGISSSHLKLVASVEGMDQKLFDECVQNAKENCPVSKALKSIDIQLEASLKTKQVT